MYKKFTERQTRSIMVHAHMLRRLRKEEGENSEKYKFFKDELVYSVEAACCEEAPKERALWFRQ